MAGHKRNRVFRLSPQMRRELRSDIDLEALEQLVGLVPPESRDLVLRAFLARPGTGSRSSEFERDELDGKNAASIGYDISFRDPDLQRLLKQVTEPTGRSHVVALARTRQFNSRERRFLEEPIGVAIISDLGTPNAGALVVRGTRTEPRDVIVLAEMHVDARWLDSAIDRLLRERRERGLRPKRPYKVKMAERSTRRLPGSWERHLLQILERVRASAPRSLGDLGMVRFTELRLK
jgi:hypothetical protein